jgi:hypothetical protein
MRVMTARLLCHPRLARGGYQIAKQSLRQRIRGHSLGMPLHAYNPLRIVSPFDGLDHSVGGMGGYPQSAAGLMDRLVVGRIDFRAGRAGKLENTAGIKLRAVHRVGTFDSARGLIIFGVVANL